MMYRSIILILFLFLNLIHHSQAGIIRGRVSNKLGEGLAFAALYIKNTNIGTTTNEQGDYSIQVQSGTHELVFQYVGYRTKSVSVTVGDEPILLDIEMETESLMLRDIIIQANEDDPAYAIIRKAQEKRRYYLREEIKSYKCRVYVKGLQRLHQKPRNFMGVKIQMDTGVVYFSESLSELSYQQPDQYKEKMISSKVSGNSRAFSFNQATDAWLNLYENISGAEITERGVVSPIASNALAYYRYRLVGEIQEGNLLIYKIKILPRRQSAPAYSGFIYITNETWRIHSSDLYLRKGVIEFVDSVAVRQIYAPDAKNNLWLPLSQKVHFAINAFGFKGTGYFVFVYSSYETEPAFERKYFNQEMIKVESEANKKDSTYWNNIRPVPLTLEEGKDYRKKDSIQVIKESKVYKDSVDNKRNRLSIGSLLWAGYTYRKSYKRESFSFQSLFSTFQYNTIEGLVTDFTIDYRKSYEDRRSFSIQPTFRYGFSNRHFQAKTEIVYNFKPLKNAFISLEGGKYVEQISRTKSISPFLNTVYTLFEEQNFLKLYEKIYGRLAYGREIIHGIRLSTSLEYSERRPLLNTSDYTIRDKANREFTPNMPFHSSELVITEFDMHQALTFGALFTFNFGQKYAVYPDRKFVMESKYPTLQLGYRKGIQALGSDIDYDFLYLRAEDRFNFGLVGQSQWNVEAGKFLNNSRLTFIDSRHFLGNQTLFAQANFDLGSYQLLDYYAYSTNEAYLKGHFEHHFNGFLFNGIPLFKKLKLQEVVSVNYLYTDLAKNYLELGFGIEHILKIIRIDFFTGLQEGKKVNNGLRIGIGF